MDDVKDYNSFFHITLPKTKTKILRIFTVIGDFYHVVKKYLEERKTINQTNRFFVTYRKGKYMCEPLGFNTIGSIPHEIAKYLKLEDPQLNTGQSFRRSSATILVDTGADITILKRHGGWKSNSVAEGYLQDSITNKNAIASRITNAVPSTSTGLNRAANAVRTLPSTSMGLKRATNAVHSTSTTSKRAKFDEIEEEEIEEEEIEEEIKYSFDDTQYANASENNPVLSEVCTPTIFAETPNVLPKNDKNFENEKSGRNLKEDENTEEPVTNKRIIINLLDMLKNPPFQFNNCNVTINININNK